MRQTAPVAVAVGPKVSLSKEYPGFHGLSLPVQFAVCEPAKSRSMSELSAADGTEK